jgi:cellulose synthase/poly-beta-1,6-N-acetylglucosamine synthase-like glycosyltransferase
MLNSFDYVYTIFLFIAIYIQVFFLILFFEHTDSFKDEPEGELFPLEDYLSATFLIPCWNEQDTVLKTIESVLAIDYPKHKFHIIAIDDGSTDKTWEMLQAYKDHPQVTLLTKENGGKHSALNYGLTKVTTDLVISFDADTEIHSDALMKAVPCFMKDDKLMALGGTVLISNPKTFVQKAQEIEYQIFSFTKKMLGLAQGVFVVPGAFSLFRKEVFDIIGGYRRAYNLEDIELTMRMHTYGLKVDHAHNAIVKTKGPSTVKGLFKQRLRWSHGFILNMIDYRKMFMNKNFKNLGLFTLPMSVFTYFLLLFVFSYSVYKVILSLYQSLLKLYLVGFSEFKWPTMDFFFVNTKAYAIMAFFVYFTIITSYVIGRHISGVKKHNFWNIPYFIFIFSIIAPFWVMKSIYSWITAKHVSWR